MTNFLAAIAGGEGLRLVAYQDIIGVWTASYGETKDIMPGMRFKKHDGYIAGMADGERIIDS
jgi:GH24 family phage-related lysozyme (muramidase)